jgi:ketosteroid isomerase-like protein
MQLLSSSVIFFGCTSQKGFTKESEIKELDKKRTEALADNDTAWLSKLYANDFIMITSTGEIRTKADQLKDIGSGIIGNQKAEENYLKFRFYKNIVVVYSETTSQLTRSGITDSSMRRFTRVFLKRNGQWQLLSTHISVVKSNNN